MNLQRPVVVANEIRMLRSHHRGSFLLTEGRDDKLAFRHVTNGATCHVKVVDGKERLCEIVCILDEDGFEGVLGVADANLDGVEGVPVVSPNILLTDDHDLDSMQLRSPALDALLRELGSDDKVAAFGDVRHAFLEAVKPIAWLRLHSRRARLALRFDGLRYGKVVDHNTLEPDVDAVILEVKNRSNRPDLQVDVLRDAMYRIEAEGHDPWRLCSGTDLLGVLSIGLRKALGSHSSGTVVESLLRHILRAAYSPHFATSNLRQRMNAWVESNPKYHLF